MGRSNPRKSRNVPALEPLEDRRLLSLPGLTSAWDASVPMVADHAILARPVWGPIAAGGEQSPFATDRVVETFGNFEAAEDSRPSDPTFTRFDQGAETFSTLHQSDPTIATSGQFAQGRSSEESSSEISGDASSTCPTSTTLVSSPSETDSSAIAPILAAQALGSAAEPAATSFQSMQAAESFGQMALPSSYPSIGSLKATAEIESSDSLGFPTATSPPANMISAPTFPPSAHAAFSEPSLHQTSFVIATTLHAEAGSDDVSGGGAHGTATDATLALIGAVEATPDVSPMTASRGPVILGSTNGLGSLAGQARVTPDPGVAKGPGEGRAVAESPGSRPLGSSTAESPEGTPDLALVEIGESTETPAPRLADLIMDILPTGRATIEGIVDRFLEPLDGVSVVMPGWDASIGLLAASLTVAATVLAVEVTLRSRRDRQVDGIDEGGGTLVDFPGLPSLGREALR